MVVNIKKPLSLVIILSLFSGLFSLAYAADDELIIFSGRKDSFVKPVTKAFTKKTGIKVLLHTANSTALLNKLRLEKSATKADLFLSNDAGNLQLGSQMGLFRPIAAELGDVIPEQYRATDNSWLGLSARARVLVVNTNEVKENEFNSVFDLAEPQWKDKIGITNSTNESYIAGVTVYMRATAPAQVKRWLKGLKANAEDSIFGKHSHIVNAVAKGKKTVGLVNHYYIYRHFMKHPDAPIAIVMPDQGENAMGVAWNVTGIAISKYSKKHQLAERFIKFLVSEEGQKLFAATNNEYPVRNGVAAAAMLPEVNSYKVASVPMVELGNYRNETIDLLEEVGMP
ncbi:Ferric iron ABC transporter, iron-binding protein [hydrothermal vent metagenome]|uniref:Ferric iron ABC transporter, iron-binding protein n=1 Tax=hydrothermal vent metagenome TaxID=652676 RepID=A0A3B0YYL5_9ZZZZ